MTKNIATPVSEIVAKQHRAEERDRLSKSYVITRQAKGAKLSSLDQQIERAVEAFRKSVDEVTEKDEAQRAAIIQDKEIALDNLLGTIRASRGVVADTLTSEDRALMIQELDKLDEIFEKSFGPQPYTPEEQTQKNTDEIERTDYVTNRKYKDDRAEEYPSIGEQLDAIWKTFDALAKGNPVPADFHAMRAKILAVKEKYPKPGASNV